MSPMHFLALQRSQAGVSKKVLCETLRHLERDGLVTRRPEIYQSAVEYSLTAVGQSLCTALEALHQWAAENATCEEHQYGDYGIQSVPAISALGTTGHRTS